MIREKEKEKLHLSATCRTIITTRLEPPIHAFFVEQMPTRKQPQIFLLVIIFQTDEALVGRTISRPNPKMTKEERTRSTHIGATRPIFSYSGSMLVRITSRPELSISSFDAVCGLVACPSSSASSSNESSGSVTITSW